MRTMMLPLMVLLSAGCGFEVAGPGAPGDDRAVTEGAIAPFSTKINFQLAGAPVPAGYVADEGDVYGPRNGLTYGWNSDHTSLCRDRNLETDQRLDTLCHFRDSQTRWELAVPNGSYEVTVSVGDAGFTSDNTIVVEGVTYWTHLELGVGQFASATKTIVVSDGRLTIGNGTNVFPSTKIDYVQVAGSARRGDAFYLSPTGDDANPCSVGARCATIAGVLAKATFGPGDAIVLGDGTYADPDINVDCSANPQKLNGTAASPITVRAEHERQAHLTSTKGQSVLVMRNCAYWSFEGLRVSQADFATKTGADVVRFYDDSNITFADSLMSRDNLLNSSTSGGLLFYDVPHFVVEDNEFYDFRRHAVLTKYQHVGGVFRRNYCNPHGQPHAAMCLSIYPGSNIIVEDNVAESGSVGFDSAPFNHDDVDNRWLGNIGVNMASALILQHSRCDGSIHDGATLGSLVRDNLAIGGAGLALYSRSSQVVARHDSAFGGTNAGFLADQETCAPVPNRFEVYDSLSVDNRYGYDALPDVVADTFLLEDVAAFGNDTSFAPASDPRITGARTGDPKMGTARVCVPTASPLHGAASDGGDIGADVLYRYQDGVKTTNPRWVTTKPPSCPRSASGIYPYGMRACVRGVNDVAATSLAGVADRLAMTRTQVESTCGAGVGYFR